MKITWLGQAGFLLENENHTILIDPYLSDEVAKINPLNWRRVPVDESFFDVKPDVIMLTHSHLDHLDTLTLSHYINEDSEITVLAPYDTWKEVRKLGGAKNNYVMLNRGSAWSFGDITVYAVKAEHSDLTAVGFVIDDSKKTYYFTGDTLYNYDVIEEVNSLFCEGVDVVFLPINGVGNNMNAEDATDFAYDVGAKKAVPVHFGLFDTLSPEAFEFENRIIPEIYKEIVID